ncbi:hypothetical protein [Salipiger mucosus]|uniref:hypothetical protein n=1 Tax=Salipiger mucosus TaxID=263378 RepID=UPI00037E1F93|nr:hypothetical protein [Salipiger mucosus]
MKRFLLTMAALAAFPAAAAAQCPEPTLTANDTVLSLMPNSSGATVAGPAGNLDAESRTWEGSVYYNSTDQQLMFCDGTEWVDVVNGKDGTGTSGGVKPAKDEIFGPFDVPQDSTQTLAAVSNVEASYYEVHIVTTTRVDDPMSPTTKSGECVIDVSVGGSWMEVARSSMYVDSTESTSTNTVRTRSPDTVVVKAWRQPDGTYKVFSGTNLAGTVIRTDYSWGSSTIGTVDQASGAFPGTLRTRTVDQADDCIYKTSVLRRNE